MIALLILAGCTGEGEVPSDPVTLVLRLENVSTQTDPVPMFAPGIAIVHAEGWSLFEEGSPASDRAGLEALAEDGDNSELLAALEGEVAEAASFAAMLPGDAAVLTIEAVPGERLTVATMFGESNDVFAALPPGGVALFDEAGEPVVGDYSASLGLFDAGTEVNQEPGAGEHQAPRQEAPDTGEAEGATVSAVFGTDNGGFTYPPADAMLKLTVEVQRGASGPP